MDRVSILGIICFFRLRHGNCFAKFHWTVDIQYGSWPTFYSTDDISLDRHNHYLRLFAFFITIASKKKYEFDYWTYSGKMSTKQTMLALLIVSIVFGVSIRNWEGLKVLKEFNTLGWLKFIFQYLYYLMEALLISLVVIFGQKAGEVKFHNQSIPWGGMLAGVTWGLVHIFTKGNINNGLIGLLMGFSYGVIYLIANKNIRIAYPLIAIMFIL